MSKYIFLQTHLWFETQSYYQKTFLCFSVSSIFSLLQTALTMISQNLKQFDDPRFTQLLATQNDCSKQYILRIFFLAQVQKCTQAPAGIVYTTNFLLCLFVLKRKSLKVFAALQPFKKLVSFVLVVNISSNIDKIVWISMLTQRHYPKN